MNLKNTDVNPSTGYFQELRVIRLSQDAILPTRAHPEDAGLDLYALEDSILSSLEGRLVRTGIAMAIPEGFVGMIADRSSMAKKGIKSAGGIIDAGYRGEIQVILRNIGQEKIQIHRGERIAQMLILPIATPAVKEVTELNSTQRGEGGFGSSGK